MRVEKTKLDGLFIIHPQVFGDERGWFMESFNQQRFESVIEELNLPVPNFVQDNHSKSSRGVLRGLHYQLPPKAQGKLVRVVQGKVWDVAVDIRKGSPTFGQWVGEELSADNHKQLWIPPGFAHGFITLSDTAEFLYKTTDYYSPEHERAIRWDDPQLAIAWPLYTTDIQISAKDQQALAFSQAEVFENVECSR
ncbi:dTDP-4-dehydrorhamnose 3,5-epimerase [Acinetobacter variabilis]|uniref:dTDP-4-dehydrorhamnose 3,5-epimerase n=1 Tax=Acinetobacter variabilis TaxID=70346 RepID=A0A7T7WIM4_9GAMM|nr:dTDP-4-dehydrorhamnose 3,5-epimerase [Acinetobacter variabilis]QQN88049.1 dTDP-4-dehydrorhamnose 3,5-epimerase [Acinetobacter variabilis]